MKERPILFSAPVVRALLAGTKTQTRRAFRVQPKQTASGMWVWGSRASMSLDTRGDHWHCEWDSDHQRMACTREAYGWGAGSGCPYGVPGDRLWVREAWRFPASLDVLSPAEVGDKVLDAGYSTPWAPIQYEADNARTSTWSAFHSPPTDTVPGRYRHARFMPRWASRITLEVTEVRVERLQDISEADARAEGAEPYDTAPFSHAELALLDAPLKDQGTPYRNGYSLLWESINGPGAWAANPWVWCVSFKRVQL